MPPITQSSRILLVDDYHAVRAMLGAFLRDLGYKQIEEAMNGTQAMITLGNAVDEGRPFQLVFSDINMPELGGLELLQIVRQDQRFDGLPFVLVTAEADRKQVGLAVLNQVTSYIIKPFTYQTIQLKMAELVERFNNEVEI